jgi:PAS domain S-box-containing protein
MYRDRPNILEKLHQCLNEKKNSTHEMKYKMQSSKEEKDFIVKYVFVPPDLVLVHTEDITDRKNAQQELKVSEEKYRKLFNNAPFAIVLFKIEGTILDCNESTKLITGYSKEELVGNNFMNFNFYVDAGSANIEERQSQIYSGKPPKEREILLYRKDGSHFWARTQIEFIHMRDGNYIQAIIHDITEKKKAEQKLIESEEKYRSLFNNMNAGFAYHEVIVDENNKPIDFKYIEVNPAFEKITGLKSRDIIGKKVTEILPGTEDDPADWIGKFGNVGLTGIPLTVEDYSEAIDRWYKVSGYSPKKGYFAVTFTDITEQKKMEQQLKESESKFRTIFEAIPDLYFLMSEDTTIIDYRGKQQDLYVNPEDLMGKKVVDILPPYLGEQTLELVKKTILTKQPQSLEYNLTIQGKIHFYEARYFYLSENRISCFVRGITEKKQKDKVISDLAKFPSENPNPVLRVNNEKIIYINQAGRELLNVTEGSKIPTLLEEITLKAFEDNKTKIFEVKADHAIYLFNITPIQNEEYANIYGQDITERKKSEIALNTEKKFTEDILNSSIDTIFVFDPETGKAHRWNRGFAEVSGYTNEEISKMKAPDSYYNEKDLKHASAAAKEVLNMGKTTVEMSLHTKDGKRIPYEYRATRFESSDGKTLIVSVGRDISDRREAERKLIESEKKYQQAYNRANFYKDLFAHDINNILQVITSSAELISLQLEDSEKSKDIENISHIIRKHVKKGAKLVKNVLKLTELENGNKITEPIELISVLKNSIKFIQSAYSERKVDINIEAFANMLSVQANDLLQEIFDNILINAVKYNKNSNIEIQIKITKDSMESKNLIKIEFLDNGIGIQDDKKKILFKEGYRKLKGSKGMGLGLSLVSKILNTFNGKIWVEDRVKGDYTKGSKFILLLPEAN